MPTCPNCGDYQTPNRVICLGSFQLCLSCQRGLHKGDWTAEDGTPISRRWDDIYGAIAADSVPRPCVYIHTLSAERHITDFKHALYRALYKSEYAQLRAATHFSADFIGAADFLRRLADCTLLIGETVEAACQEIIFDSENCDFLPKVMLVLVGAHQTSAGTVLLKKVPRVEVRDASPASVETVLTCISTVIRNQQTS